MTMHNQTVWLAPDCIAEPLLDSWHAWGYLVPPMQAGMLVRSRHIPVMESFVAEPELHISALRNPDLIGGPYLGCALDEVEQVRALLESTQISSRPLLQLAEAYERLEEELRRAPAAMSLEPLYAAVPDILKGYVELVHDRWHQPHARILEALLYRSGFHDRSRHSFLLQRGDFDRREFVFSTPRLAQTARGQVRLGVSFDQKALDLLFRSRTEGHELGLLLDTLGRFADDTALLSSMFVAQPPERARRVPQAEGFAVRYFGHACVLVEGRGFSALIDPLIPLKGSGPSRFSYADLPDHIDFVLLTHAHQDHVVLETLLQIRHKIGEIVVPHGGGGTAIDPSLKQLLHVLGFDRVREVVDLEVVSVGSESDIIALPFLGEHGDLDVRSKSSYAIRSHGRCVVALADSNGLEPRVYEKVSKEIGEVDLLLIGMECEGAPVSWLYGPLLGTPLRRRADQSRRLSGSDCDRAMAIVRALRAKRALVYAMGAEPWCRFMTAVHYTDVSVPIVESEKFISACRAEGVDAARLFGATDLLV